MPQQPYISIIIAVYNVAQHIEHGIEQILNQSFKDYEIILVDDGSTDESGIICDNIATKYHNIHVIHKNNTGSGYARNEGINIATGRYIWFFDVDDTIEPNLLEKCSDILLQQRPEVLIFSYDEINPFYQTTTTCVFEQIQTKTNDDVKGIYVSHLLGLNFNNGFVWNKFYSRDYINKHNIKFENQRIQQDEIFNLHVYKHLNRLVIIQDILYHYYIYNDGNTRSRYIPERFEIYKEIKSAFLDLYNFWELNSHNMLRYIHNRFFNNIIETINFNLYHKNANLSKSQRKIKIAQIFNDIDTINTIYQLDALKCIPTNFLKKHYFYSIKNNEMIKYHIIRLLNNSISTTKRFIKKLI